MILASDSVCLDGSLLYSTLSCSIKKRYSKVWCANCEGLCKVLCTGVLAACRDDWQPAGVRPMTRLITCGA